VISVARIEQNPDGTYGKRMSETERRAINMIYKEQNDRADAEQQLQLQINQNVQSILQVNTSIGNMLTSIGQMNQRQDTDHATLDTLVAQINNTTNSLNDLITQLKQKGVIN
jgi:uncharacterized protein YoxC